MFKNTRIVVETIQISLALLKQSYREQACARAFARVLDLLVRCCYRRQSRKEMKGISL